MKSVATKRFWDCFDSLPVHAQRQARTAFALWQADPGHRSLAFKRIQGRHAIVSVRVGRHWRAVGGQEGDTVIWFWIGSHAEYDGLLARLRF